METSHLVCTYRWRMRGYLLSLLKSLGRRSLADSEDPLPAGTSRYLVRGKAALSLLMELQDKLITGWSCSITVRKGSV